MFAEGAYARDTIEQIISSFKGSPVIGDDETFMQMTDLLEIFYNDPDMNRELTKVRGNDFCEMLGLFFDLTDRIRTYMLSQLEGKEKLLTQYEERFNDMLAAKKPQGNGSTTATSRGSSTMQGRGTVGKKKKAKTKKIGLEKETEDSKYLVLLEEN